MVSCSIRRYQADLRLACDQGKLPGIDLDDITYFIGRETIIPSDQVAGMALWRETVFAFPAAQTPKRSAELDDLPGRHPRTRRSVRRCAAGTRTPFPATAPCGDLIAGNNGLAADEIGDVIEIDAGQFALGRRRASNPPDIVGYCMKP